MSHVPGSEVGGSGGQCGDRKRVSDGEIDAGNNLSVLRHGGAEIGVEIDGDRPIVSNGEGGGDGGTADAASDAGERSGSAAWSTGIELSAESDSRRSESDRHQVIGSGRNGILRNQKCGIASDAIEFGTIGRGNQC